MKKNINLTDKQIKLLEKEKEVTGKTIEAIIRLAVDQYFWETGEDIGLHGRQMSYEQMKNVLDLQRQARTR